MISEELNREWKRAWKEVLFWARRMSYISADEHPEWADRLAEARKRRDDIKKRMEASGDDR